MTTRPRRSSSLALLLFAFSACTSGPEYPPQASGVLYAPSTVQHFQRVEDVVVQTSDTPSEIAAKHGGTVVSWHPELGYATLGFEPSAEARAQGVSVPKDYRAPSADDPKAYGLSAWTSGWNAWGSGWNAWGSGWTAWGSGGGANTPGQNARIWDKIKLTQATRLAPNAGQGVVVAVIDTGIDLQHPAFQGVLAPSSTWWDWVSGDPTPQDESGGTSFGHGTCVAGIVLQVAPKARIMPLRVLGADGLGETANVIAAIDWAVAKGANIINLSLGTTRNKTLQRAIDNATRKGVFVIASSGNTGDQNVTYPASDSIFGVLGNPTWADMVIGVGSTDVNDRKSRFSTFSMISVEMSAVGEGVSSPAPGRRMATWSGTSMAAPMVSGGLALALGQRSFSDLRAVSREITADTDRLILTEPTYWGEIGGRLNLETFLKSVLDSKFK
jgi:subtilisin family serine protease